MSVKTPSRLEKIFSQGHIAVTSECGPPRGSDPEAIKEKGALIRDHVDAVNVTDNQTSVVRLCSLAACTTSGVPGFGQGFWRESAHRP